MFGGLTKTSSRIAIAAALGMTLGGFALSASPAKAADLGGDCCADLEERVAELEATTVRKGNKKVSVTLSGWVVKVMDFWDDGHENNVYIGDKDTTLSSHFTLSGSAQIAPGWSAGYNLTVEVPGNGCGVGFAGVVATGNQFNDNGGCAFGTVNTLLSYMWLKSDKWGTVNWGQLSQATDNVALLPDLSGTVIESNGVVFDGAGMFVRPKGAKNSNDLAGAGSFAWAAALTCQGLGFGIGADCNGYPNNAVRYDTPTWAGFSASTSYGEDDFWDVALKYAADWNSVKVSAAVGYSEQTDEGCGGVDPITGPYGASPGVCTNITVLGGGGAPHQNYRKDAGTFQVGASIMHVPSGLFFYGMYENEQNNGTQLATFNSKGNIVNSAANENDSWFIKAGIKRTFTPAGATVIWGEWGQYNDMFGGFCGGGFCAANLTTGINADGTTQTTYAAITGSEVTRYGVGVVQEIDSAAMHLFARWQHLDLDLNAINGGQTCLNGDTNCYNNGKAGKNLTTSWEGLDIFQIGGVIFF